MKAIIDCNSFYCSCERLFRPDLENKPVVVLSNNDGCIISRTDEAKKAGVEMASPYYQNKEIIEKNNVAVFSSNYNLYGDLSMRVMDTLRMLLGSDAVEVYSVDEAFLDFSETSHGKITSVARQLKDTVEQWTGIKVSIGVGPSKVLSKVANRLSKKDKAGTKGILVLDSEEKIKDALQQTRVDDIWGIGRQYAIKLHSFGIDDGWQLRNLPEEWARKNMGGVVGLRLIKELKGIPCIPMKAPLETKKMILTGRMFGTPVFELASLREAIATYTSRAAEKLRRQYCLSGLVNVFLVVNGRINEKYNYNPQSRYLHLSLPYATCDTALLIKAALSLTEKIFEPGMKYIKAGVLLGAIVPGEVVQTNVFEDMVNRQALMNAIDNINFGMKQDTVKYAASGLKRNWKMRQELRSKRFTTRWDELFEIK